MDNNKILKQVDDYYTEKVQTFGATPKGVDWNSVESQNLRFEVLTKVINADAPFSVLDYGTGFGAMYEYMLPKHKAFEFIGYDISGAMIAEAKKKFAQKNTLWTTELSAGRTYDFAIASGIFNVRLNNSEAEWKKYILDTIKTLNSLSVKGFSFNLLTKYSDLEYMKDYLYYADPLELFDFCKVNFSKQVALLHDYPLYEFTIIVRK
jgi:SAM-dependent methyltransferase